MSEGKRNEIALQLIQEEQEKTGILIKKLPKRRLGNGNIKAAADALVAQASNDVKKEGEQCEKDVLALISIQNQLMSRKEKEKIKRKSAVPSNAAALAAESPQTASSLPSSSSLAAAPLVSANLVSNNSTTNGSASIISTTSRSLTRSSTPFVANTAENPSSISNPSSSPSFSHNFKENTSLPPRPRDCDNNSPDLDSALAIIARLEITLSEQSNESIQQQTLLRRQVDAANETLATKNLQISHLEEECRILRMQNQSQSLQSEQVLLLEQKLEASELQKAQLEASNESLASEKQKLTFTAAHSQDLVDQLKKTIERKTKEWYQRQQAQQDAHTNQILGLSGEMDTMQRTWKRKAECLDAELKREKYEKDSLRLQFKLKQVQCEKSDNEAFNAKKLLNQANEDLRQAKTANDRSLRQYLDSQATVRDLQDLLKKNEGKSTQSDGNLSQIVQHLTQKVRELERNQSASQATITQLRESLEVASKEKMSLQESLDTVRGIKAERDSLLAQLDITQGTLSNISETLLEKETQLECQETEIQSLKQELACGDHRLSSSSSSSVLHLPVMVSSVSEMPEISDSASFDDIADATAVAQEAQVDVANV